MNQFKETWRSGALGRDMQTAVYGTGGAPVLMFPTQNGGAEQYERFGVTDLLRDYIDSGRVQIFCTDTADDESWCAAAASPADRSARAEAFYRHVTDEVLPFIHRTNASAWRPFTCGCSLGATHAAIFALRRPDLFQGCLALSGMYDAEHFWHGWMDDTLYFNSPVHFLGGMTALHPYVRLYNERKLIFAAGTGAWEQEAVRTLAIVRDEFAAIGAHAWCDFWGADVCHDWPWWKKQLRYFLPFLLGDR